MRSTRPATNLSGKVILHIDQYTSTGITDPIDIIKYEDTTHLLPSTYSNFSTRTSPGGVANTPFVDNFSIKPDNYKINVYEIGLLKGDPLNDSLNNLKKSRNSIHQRATEIVMDGSGGFNATPRFKLTGPLDMTTYNGFYIILDAEIHAKTSIDFVFSGAATTPPVVITDRAGITKSSAFTINTNGSKSNITSNAEIRATSTTLDFDTEYINILGDTPIGYTQNTVVVVPDSDMKDITATERVQLLTESFPTRRDKASAWTAATKYWHNGVNSWDASGKRIKQPGTTDYILFVIPQDIKITNKTRAMAINFKIGEALEMNWDLNTSTNKLQFMKFGMNAFTPSLEVS